MNKFHKVSFEEFKKATLKAKGFRNHVRKGKKLISCEACFLVWDSKNGWHEGSLKNER